MSDTVSTVLPFLQTILAFGNICILVFAFIKFLGKPHDSIDKRVTSLEAWRGEVDQSLKRGNDKFRNIDEATQVIMKSIIALIEFEMDYCATEHKPVSKNLEKAKDDLHDYLAKRGTSA